MIDSSGSDQPIPMRLVVRSGFDHSVSGFSDLAFIYVVKHLCNRSCCLKTT